MEDEEPQLEGARQPATPRKPPLSSADFKATSSILVSHLPSLLGKTAPQTSPDDPQPSKTTRACLETLPKQAVVQETLPKNPGSPNLSIVCEAHLRKDLFHVSSLLPIPPTCPPLHAASFSHHLQAHSTTNGIASRAPHWRGGQIS